MKSISATISTKGLRFHNSSASARTLINGLKIHYLSRTPTFDAITHAMTQRGIIESASEVENDHIALRTMNTSQLGIKSLAKLFTAVGYTQQDEFDFPEKKLTAFWFAPPDPALPRIFISELRVEELSQTAQDIIHSFTDPIQEDPVDMLPKPITAARAWQYLTRHCNTPYVLPGRTAPVIPQVPSWMLYRQLAEESEYAAWWLVNRHVINHATFCIHNLPAPYNTLEAFNAFLQKEGFALNDSGGLVKESADTLLRQSSTVAGTHLQRFAEGWFPVQWAFVEFAERRVLPEFAHFAPADIQSHHRRDGFEARNADRIFESTNAAQANRRIRVRKD